MLTLMSSTTEFSGTLISDQYFYRLPLFPIKMGESVNCGVWNDGGIRGWSKSTTSFKKTFQNEFVFCSTSVKVHQHNQNIIITFLYHVGDDLDQQIGCRNGRRRVLTTDSFFNCVSFLSCVIVQSKWRFISFVGLRKRET